jgi:signal transduction histidine kinase
MIESIAFRTRARTIDHLGREQIADCPTAISELWKNAYDAYARKVSLHIYSGDQAIAAILDDGHGMSRAEFENKWLVIGTESKATESIVPNADRNELPFRPKQGQKGIGRLSSASLGSLLLLISKRKDDCFVASLIDWRLFENPFIYLQDVEIPVVEFDETHLLWEHLPTLFDKMMGNLRGDGRDPARDSRIVSAWSNYDRQELAESKPSTRVAIENSLLQAIFSERHLEAWPPWSSHELSGTAMIMAHLSYDLRAQLHSAAADAEIEIVKQAREKLTQTLVSFTDPFLPQEQNSADSGESDFSYSITAWEGSLPRTIISNQRVFGYNNLLDLEHVLDGVIDKHGIFKGRVKVFGEWLEGEVTIMPPGPIPTRSDSIVGGFDIRIGTFEITFTNSVLPEATHSILASQVEHFGGLMVFRDGLRVMPYGRTNNDFFEIDQRRNMNAGREFWANRRLFGRVALTRGENPNLRDKAGREGIIDNRAAKVFRDIVINILMTSARRFFGSASDIRKEKLPEIQKFHEREAADAAQKKIRARKRKEFRQNLEKNLPKIQALHESLEKMAGLAESESLPTEEGELFEFRNQLMSLKEKRSELSIGSPPSSLGILENDYNDFRKTYNLTQELVTRLSDSISFALEKMKPTSAHDKAYSELSRNASHIQSKIRRLAAEAREILSSEIKRVGSIVEEKNKQYHATTLPLLDDLENNRIAFSSLLRKLESERESQEQDITYIFDSYISTLRNLQDNVNIESLVNFTIQESTGLRSELDRLNSLAQLGIAVEIISHEMDGIEVSIVENLACFPSEVKATSAYRSVVASNQSLMEKLRFLSPLKLSGEATKVWISGEHIIEYVNQFLGKAILNSSVNFHASENFMNFKLLDLPSRIYPVFINLVNNSIYWVTNRPNAAPEIQIDVVDERVVISDNGPGVEEDDKKNLFGLFFTRKIRGGRGVGLYLCRANLAAGGHHIAYASEKRFELRSGANFVIDFKGAKYD